MLRLVLGEHAIGLKRGRRRGSIEVAFPGRTGLRKVRTREADESVTRELTAAERREFLAGG
jgi:hypothetical protein